MTILEVTPSQLQAIVRQTFGAEARVASVREIVPVSEHGVLRVVGCTGNLSYAVCLEGRPDPYIFRFNRGYRGDRFDHEKEIYALIAARTPIPVPAVYAVDRSGQIVSTSYMIMDCMPGEEASYLAHPANPDTTPEEKEEILRLTGRAYAQLHAVERTAADPESLRKLLFLRTRQLEDITRYGFYDLELPLFDACRRALEADETLALAEESLCLSDGELHLKKEDGAWHVSFVCDTEWADYGDPCLDLTLLACAPRKLWGYAHPLGAEHFDSPQARLIFDGYEALRPINRETLIRRAFCHQYSVMCSFLDQALLPEKEAFMRSLAPVYRQLIEKMAYR